MENYSLNKICKTISAIGCTVAILSWFEFLPRSYFIAPLKQTISYQSYSGFRACVFSRSYLSHGIILGFFSIVCLYLYFIDSKNIYLIECVFCYLSILTTSSRGPLVACGIGLLIMYLMEAFISKRRSYKRYVAMFFLLFLGLFLLLIMLSDFTTSNDNINYFLYRVRSILNWNGDAGNVGRIRLWNKSINLWYNNKFFGIGASKTGSWGSASIGVTESGVLKRLCELGIIGFCLYYYLAFTPIKKMFKYYRCLNIIDKRKIVFYIAVLVSILIDDITLQVTEEIMISFLLGFSMAGIVNTLQKSSVKNI